MKLIEADKVKQAIKDYWKAQVDRLPIPKNIEEHDAYANRLGTILEYNSELLKEIEALPSIQPEHKTGRWIPTASGKGRHECSRCHEYAPCYQDGSEHLSTFCVLCGAKMERGEEE